MTSSYALRTRLRGLFSIAFLALVAAAGYAQLGGPGGVYLPYAGYLESAGAPVSSVTPLNFRFTFWNAAADGATCGSPIIVSSPVSAGRFGVEVGPVPESCAALPQLFLAVEVEDDATYVALSGRQRVLPAVGAVTSGGGDFVVAQHLDVGGDAYVGKLRVEAVQDVGLAGASGSIIVGSSQGLSIGVDDNEIMARNGNVASTLFLNNEGGNVQIGNFASTVTTAGTVSAGAVSATTVSATTVSATTVNATTFGCPVGWTAIAGGRLCLENAVREGPMHTSDGTSGALNACRGMAARVCSHNDIQQACGAGVNPFTDRNTSVSFWLGDLVGDDTYMIVNSYQCTTSNITGQPTNGISGYAGYRCCM